MSIVILVPQSLLGDKGPWAFRKIAKIADMAGCTDIDGEPWFVLSDVCRELGLANIGNAAARLDADEKSSIRNPDVTSLGGNPNITVISEPGLYKLIFRSNKPAAKDFVNWVTKVVLPSIRKTGGYGANVPAFICGGVCWPDSECSCQASAGSRLHTAPQLPTIRDSPG